MFKLNPHPTFTAKTPLSVPGSDSPVTVDIEYKHLSRDGIKDYFARLQGRTDLEALSEIIVGWKQLDAEFSPENLAALLGNYPASAGELFETFRRELMESRRKN